MSYVTFTNQSKFVATSVLALPADVLFAMAQFRQACDQDPKAVNTAENAAATVHTATVKLEGTIREYVKSRLVAGEEKSSPLDEDIFRILEDIHCSTAELLVEEQLDLICNLFVGRIVELMANAAGHYLSDSILH